MTSVHLLHRAPAPTETTRSARSVRSAEPPRILEEPAVRFGLGGFALFVAAGVITALDLTAVAGTAVVLLVTVTAALPLTRALACGLGIAGWAFAEGFALHAYGELALAPADLGLLAGFVLVALVCAERIGRTS